MEARSFRRRLKAIDPSLELIKDRHPRVKRWLQIGKRVDRRVSEMRYWQIWYKGRRGMRPVATIQTRTGLPRPPSDCDITQLMEGDLTREMLDGRHLTDADLNRQEFQAQMEEDRREEAMDKMRQEQIREVLLPITRFSLQRDSRANYGGPTTVGMGTTSKHHHTQAF